MKLYPCKLNVILFFVPAIFILILTGCSATRRSSTTEPPKSGEIKSTVKIKNKIAPRFINTKNVSRVELVDFAETLNWCEIQIWLNGKRKRLRLFRLC